MRNQIVGTAVLVAVLFLIGSSGVYAQFKITCSEGVVESSPDGEGVMIVCVPYTPTPIPSPTNTVTDVPTATKTPTQVPTSTEIPPTATNTVTAVPTATNTPIPLPTVTPTPIPTSSGILLAFPGAEGFGANALGGRGGKVMEVTNLNDSGAGSLRACVIASGPRICVFRTGGTIELLTTLEVKNPYLTIAGQTAPGGGIQLKIKDPTKSTDLFKISTYEVIVRYIKLRPGTQDANARASSTNAGGSAPLDKLAHNIIFDHVSMQWAGDEILIAWDRTHHVTWQYSIMAESIAPGWKGPNLGKYGGGPYTMYANLMAFHAFRLPNSSASGGTTEVINNLIYDFKRFGIRSTLGSMNNVIGNYIEAGPDTQSNAYYIRDDQDAQDPDSDQPIPNPTTRGWYLADNIIQAKYNGVTKIQGLLPTASMDKDVKSVPYASSGLLPLPSDRTYEEVLNNSGAIHGLNCDGTWYLRRDSVDQRIVDAVRADRSSHNTATVKVGYIKNPAEVGGWPSLEAGEPCADADKDGIFDEYEELNGLTVGVDNSNLQHPSGFTWLDIFLGGK